MEGLFEFLFGAGGRINRATYWRSVLTFIFAGTMTAVILFSAAEIAAPLFVIMVVFVLVPWLLWGLSFTTKRLHDRNKSAWWLAVFYLIPGMFGKLAEAAWFAAIAGAVLQYFLALASIALVTWGFVEIGCLRGTAGSNSYGPYPHLEVKRRR